MQVQVYEAPQHYDGNSLSLFLAGGITGCPDWQQDMIATLKDTRLVLFNPRRANFPIGDPSAAYEQIEWEHTYLRRATAISFWFPMDTLNPITLYELGAWSMRQDKRIFVGCHPDYKRKQDVMIQTALVRPQVQVVQAFEELCQQLIRWVS